jgi:hypothetical protein
MYKKQRYDLGECTVSSRREVLYGFFKVTLEAITTDGFRDFDCVEGALSLI